MLPTARVLTQQWPYLFFFIRPHRSVKAHLFIDIVSTMLRGVATVLICLPLLAKGDDLVCTTRYSDGQFHSYEKYLQYSTYSGEFVEAVTWNEFRKVRSSNYSSHVRVHNHHHDALHLLFF